MRLVGAVAHGDVAGLDLLLADDEHVRRAVDVARLADLVADLLVALVEDRADASRLKLLGHAASVVAALLGHG